MRILADTPEGSAQLQQLQNIRWTGLDVEAMGVSVLSPALFAFKHVTALYLARNAITELSGSIGQMTQLSILDVSYNALLTVPLELCTLIDLSELYLHANQLRDLPTQLGNLFQLEVRLSMKK